MRLSVESREDGHLYLTASPLFPMSMCPALPMKKATRRDYIMSDPSCHVARIGHLPRMVRTAVINFSYQN